MWGKQLDNSGSGSHWLRRACETWVGGIDGDKQGGIAELQTTAEHGQLLAPFARILLAIAYVREKNTVRAKEMLVGLQREFPENSLFAKELARIDKNLSR